MLHSTSASARREHNSGWTISSLAASINAKVKFLRQRQYVKCQTRHRQEKERDRNGFAIQVTSEYS